MSLKEAIREKALELGFEDAGFTGVEPLNLYIQEIESRPPEMYGWCRPSNSIRCEAQAQEKSVIGPDHWLSLSEITTAGLFRRRWWAS